MLVNRQTIEYRVLSLIAETVGSPIAALLPETTNTAVIDTSDQIAGFALDAARWLCRACVPVLGTATGTVAAGTAGWNVDVSGLAAASIKGSTSSFPAGCQLWAASRVTTGTGDLTRLDYAVFNATYSSSTGAGALARWCRYGSNDVIRVAPPASTSTAITVEGLVLPGPLDTFADDTAGFSYAIPDDVVLEGVCAIAAYTVCLQNTDDTQIAARKGELLKLADTVMLRQWGMVDGFLKKWAYGNTLTMASTALASGMVGAGKK